jgi:diguanylate cyclase
VSRLFTCIAFEHDFRLVLLAALVCFSGCFVACRIAGRMSKSRQDLRYAWLALGGLAGGSAVWTTHFVAMLAYRPDLQSGFAPGPSVASLLVAIVATACAFAVFTARPGPLNRIIGGALFGLGVAAMHYIGMSAYRLHGILLWDPTFVAASILAGTACAALAFWASPRLDGLLHQLRGAALMSLAIVVLHFTAMAALTVTPLAGDTPLGLVMPAGVMALTVAGLAALVIFGGFSAAQIDAAADRATLDRMRRLANAASEGMVAMQSDAIVHANAAFAAMVGSTPERLIGLRLFDVLVLDGPEGGSVHEGWLLRLDAVGRRPVEVSIGPFPGAVDQDSSLVFVRDLAERKAAEAKVRYLADHDGLTDLLNAHALRERIDDWAARVDASGERLAVVRFDLDRYAEIKDLLGAPAADAALVETGRRLEAFAGPGVAMSRLTGGEFGLVQVSARERAEAVGELAAAILESLAQPFEWQGAAVELTPSLGISLYPEDADVTEGLIARADAARRRARDAGGGVFRFFKPGMDQAIQERRRLVGDLGRAILDGSGLMLHYQPVAETCGEIAGFEALVRWNHAEMGLLSPAMFVPLAEDTGQILALGEWVLNTACQEAAAWPRPLHIAINISPVQLRQPDLPAKVQAALSRTGLDPARLVLEITETALITDEARALDTLGQLKALGVRIAMDDFGTGYSSLSTLNAFPFDKIKIDKSFVSGAPDDARAQGIVRAVIGLGRSVGAPVVAEGVETAEQLAFLRQEGCAEVQGYLIGRPEPIAAWADVVGRAPPRRLAAIASA